MGLLVHYFLFLHTFIWLTLHAKVMAIPSASAVWMQSMLVLAVLLKVPVHGRLSKTALQYAHWSNSFIQTQKLICSLINKEFITEHSLTQWPSWLPVASQPGPDNASLHCRPATGLEETSTNQKGLWPAPEDTHTHKIILNILYKIWVSPKIDTKLQAFIS